MTPKKWKNGPQKLLIIGPDSFASQSSPDHSPRPIIFFFTYEILGPDICFFICASGTFFTRDVSKANFRTTFWNTAVYVYYSTINPKGGEGWVVQKCPLVRRLPTISHRIMLWSQKFYSWLYPQTSQLEGTKVIFWLSLQVFQKFSRDRRKITIFL